MKPAAELVSAFHIQVGGPRQARFPAEHRKVASAGIEPDIQNVLFLAELCRAAVAALRPGWKKLRGGLHVPSISSFPCKYLNDVRERMVIREKLITFCAIEHHNRHAPDALPRDAPVRPRREHIREPLH